MLDVLASAPEPAVFFCAAGKDRTGLVTAMLLGTLGVADDDIAGDYSLTADVMPGILDRARRWSKDPGSVLSFPPQVYGAEAETMLRVLSEVRGKHGSVLGYVLDSGLDISTVETLRDDVAKMREQMATKENLARLEGRFTEMRERMATKEDLARLEGRFTEKVDVSTTTVRGDIEQVQLRLVSCVWIASSMACLQVRARRR